MAQWYRAFVKVQQNSGLPKDAIQNTFAFMVEGSADRDLIAADIDTRLTAFYTAFGSNLSSLYQWNTATLQVIDMTDDQPRVPFWESDLTITGMTGTNNDMPPEVACCLSFQGAHVSGVNMRRRRGRVFIGPLQLGSGDVPVVPSAIYNAIATAAGSNLLNPTLPAGLSDWAVYSPYTHHGIPVGQKLTPDDPEIPDFLPASFTPVERCWVDDAWDTQRRRGRSATARTTVVAS